MKVKIAFKNKEKSGKGADKNALKRFFLVGQDLKLKMI